MYVAEAVELVESPLEFWRRVGNDDGAALRSLALRLAATAGPLRTLLGFRQPTERPRAATFDCEMQTAGGGPGGSMFVVWDVGLARLEGELEVVPNGTTHELKLSASYEPPWAATLVADQSGLRRMAKAALRDFLQAVERPVEASAAVSVRRRHVLIEDADPTWHRFMVALADGEDCEFDGCRGPALVPGGCPIVRGENCPKVEWADVILNSLDDQVPDNAALIDGLTRRWPEATTTMLAGQPPTRCLYRHPDFQLA